MAPLPRAAPHFIGSVMEVASGSTTVRLVGEAIAALRNSKDAVLAMTGTVGAYVRIDVGGVAILGQVRVARAVGGAIFADIDLLGEGRPGENGEIRRFSRGLTRYPGPGDAVLGVVQAELKDIFGSNTGENIGIGVVYPTFDVRAMVGIDALLGKHFALLGSTGSGKSTAAALILHRIIDGAPEAHIVVIDPHGEYGSAFAERGLHLDVDNLHLPYWLMNFEEHCEVFITSEGVERELDRAILAKCLMTARGKSVLAAEFGAMTVDSPVPYLIFELLGALQFHMGKLDHAAEVARYQRLRNRIDEILRDPRYGFMFDRERNADSMKAFLARVLRLPGDGRPITIIDLSGVPSDIVSTVVALLARIVMDFATWARNEAQVRPILLVCEEAHRYVPSERSGTGAAARRVLERIAKEGRKYGVSLALITQRPSDLAEGALSQCGTIIAMRLNNARDQACVESAMPEGGRGLIDVIPALRKGECIICGEGVAIPMRVRMDELAAELRPRSADPSFSALWRQSGGEDAMLDRVILRWRSRQEEVEAAAMPARTVASLLLRPLAAE